MKYYIIIEPGLTGLHKYQVLNAEELQDAKEKYESTPRHRTFTYRKLPE